MEMSIFEVGKTGMVYHERITEMNFVTESISSPQQKISALYAFYYEIKKNNTQKYDMHNLCNRK
jgi:hypothetical protein